MTAVALHHELAGPETAPALVLGGSLGTTLAMWEPQLPALSQRLRVIRYDHRGHGGSPAPPGPYEIADLGRDVLALLDRLGIARASHCGVSFGGMVGIWLAANAPERVDRLVLACTSARLPPASAWQERAAAVRAAGTTEVVADTVVSRWLTPGFAERNPGVRAWLRAMIASASPDGYAECCGAIARMDLRALLPRIAAPTLVISGSEDPATPLEHQRVIAERVPGARHEVVRDAAHIASVERADVVTRMILDHVNPQESR